MWHYLKDQATNSEATLTRSWKDENSRYVTVSLHNFPGKHVVLGKDDGNCIN